MARQGRATEALSYAFLSAAFGALFRVVVITLLAAPAAAFAHKFSSPEYFAVYFLAFACFIGLGGASPFKTLVSAGMGFSLAAVGMDTISGSLRLTFGLVDLGKGVSFLVAVIGLFGTPRCTQDDRQVAVLLGSAGPLQSSRLLDGDHARRPDRRVVHELRACQAFFAAIRAVRQRRAGGRDRARGRGPFCGTSAMLPADKKERSRRHGASGHSARSARQYRHFTRQDPPTRTSSISGVWQLSSSAAPRLVIRSHTRS